MENLTNMLLKMIETEAFWTALTVFTGIFFWKQENAKKIQEDKRYNLEKYSENNRKYRENYFDVWKNIACYPEDNRKIFLKNIEEISVEPNSDELLADIFHTIAILSDVFEYHQEIGRSIDKSVWKKEFAHVFSPKKIALITAYQKYKADGTYSEAFCKYVEKTITQQSTKKESSN